MLGRYQKAVGHKLRRSPLRLTAPGILSARQGGGKRA
jgi:hypothetical protein